LRAQDIWNAPSKPGFGAYLLKDARIEEVVDAIRWVHAGQKVMSPDLLLEAISSPNPLSARELDVLRHVQKGLSTREVAKLLFLSEGTVRNYLSDVIAKLCCTTRQDAVRIAEERGWL
jgi:two-component system, NarL family, response regulator DesR